MLLKEGFESNSKGSFDSIVSNGAGVASFDANSKISGVYSLKSSFAGAGEAYVQRSFGDSYETIFVQQKILLPEDWVFGSATYFTIIRILDSEGSVYFALNVEDWGVPALTLFGSTLGWKNVAESLSIGTVNTVEMRLFIGGESGNVKVWLNNTSEVSPDYNSGDADTGSTSVSVVQCGVPDADGAISDLYTDDVRIDTSFIGEGKTPIIGVKYPLPAFKRP